MDASNVLLDAPKPRYSHRRVAFGAVFAGCALLLAGYSLTRPAASNLASFPVMTSRSMMSCPATCARNFGVAKTPMRQFRDTASLRVRGGAMTEIAKGVSFDTVAREWRMKWTGDEDKASLVAAQAALDEVLSEVKAVPGVKSVQRVVCGGCLDFKVVTADKASLVAAQAALDEVLSEVKAVPGVKSVQRVVCGGCLDFKVVTALDGEKFGEWETASFAPEEKFLDKVKKIPGISMVETQTYTLMPM
eukprot:CAMPEP_0114536816 /NCGR_PEP_ID=MMETSP0109-20121206/29219_1 /TAXON_ID=29199 /ORGANISM="Chlorarachnion reptans, Strain CCCM449" /LENGTH=246 /DNA_ID=CAMNT_0001720609 /DNA_START=139 /DNA_END=880 /DNA_ORIENTATION=-